MENIEKPVLVSASMTCPETEEEWKEYERVVEEAERLAREEGIIMDYS